MPLPLNQVICGDCLEIMKTFPCESVDLIVTDPPYGYSFMGKDWDKAVPSVDVWKECLRVLKSGAFAFVMSSPRQDVLSQMIVRLGMAGFETGFSSIYWAYASGFPKAMNISKAVDKRLGLERKVIGTKQHSINFEKALENKVGYLADEANKNNKACFGYGEEKLTVPSSQEAKVLDGSYGGFQPKPAVEVIIVCMKPLSEKTYVDQALTNQKGVTWLDDTRIPFEENPTGVYGTSNKTCTPTFNASVDQHDFRSSPHERGRFPANLLISDDALNDGRIIKTTYVKNQQNREGAFLSELGHSGNQGYDDSGSFSRFFDLDKWFQKTVENLPEAVRKTLPFLICPKASKSERNKGCEGLPEQNVRKEDGSWGSLEVFSNSYTEQSGNPSNRGTTPKHHNIHPTVKPLKLMSYLVTLGSRPNDVVLDPFVGSGTTCLASEMLGRQWIGIDISSEYVEIAQKRLATIPAKITAFF